MKQKSAGKYIGTFFLVVVAVVSCFTCMLLYRCLTTNSTPTSHIDEPNTIITTTPTTTKPQSVFALTQKQEQTLSNFIKKYKGNVSVYYQDLESGYTYTYKADQKYFAASLMKAPYCHYILQMAAEGKCNLNEELTYTEKFYRGGTGIIQQEPYGSVYTIKTLIEYAIRYSDNIALRMLLDRFKTDGFKEFAEKQGVQDIEGIASVTNSSITVNDAAKYMNAIYNFIELDDTCGTLLKQYMGTTKNSMLTSSYPILRKYGWADASFHDMGIVQAPHPYILIICSDRDDGTAADFNMFRNICSEIEKLSNQERQ